MRFALALLALLFLANSADAQRRHRALAKQGDLAIAVGFNGLETFRINPLAGGLGLRYRVADRTVLGTAFAMGGRESTSVQEREEIQNVDQERTVTLESSRRTVSLALFVEQHVGRRRSAVSPFIGAGVQAGFGDDTQTSATRNESSNEEIVSTQLRTVREESESTTFGAGLVLGAEVKIISGVTLAGAYTFGASYSDTIGERREVFRETRQVGGETTSMIELETVDAVENAVGP